MVESLLSPNQKLDIEDKEISPEFSEIACMCEKCDCDKLVPIVVSICESCLSSKHLGKIDISFSS